MSFRYVFLHECLQHVPLFFEDMGRVWVSRGGEEGGIDSLLEEKLDAIRNGSIKGIMVFQGNSPVGIAWVDRVVHNYGNMMMHGIIPEAQEAVPKLLYESGLMEGALLELIHFHDTSVYRETFYQHDLQVNHRQRMAVYLDGDPFMPGFGSEVSFLPLTRKLLPVFSEIGAKAHQVSKDYVGYYDLEDPVKRVHLDQIMFDGVYGPFVPNISQLLLVDNEVIGGCAYVEVACWGYEKVPWVFDLVIDPKWHGKGYGKLLFLKTIAELLAAGYPMVGLAVTMNNTSAKALYESIGFQCVDEFWEFACHVA